MGSLSFTYVHQEGLTSFNTDLAADAWAAVDTTPWEGPNKTGAKPLGDAPVVVVHKLRLTWGIAGIVEAIGGASTAKECDKTWDGAQKPLRALIAAASAGSDQAKRDAGSRLQKTLLLGAGEKQTTLKYQQEVDFGRKQALLIASGQGAADVALLGLGGVMDEIEKATEALSIAIGHGESSARPFERLEGVALRSQRQESRVPVARSVSTNGWSGDGLAQRGDEHAVT
jgi:hypothetical protein